MENYVATECQNMPLIAINGGHFRVADFDMSYFKQNVCYVVLLICT